MELPRVMFLHFWDKAKLETRAAVKAGVKQNEDTIAQAKKGETPAEEVGFRRRADPAKLGHKGTVKNGVLHVSVPSRKRSRKVAWSCLRAMGRRRDLMFRRGRGKVAPPGILS